MSEKSLALFQLDHLSLIESTIIPTIGLVLLIAALFYSKVSTINSINSDAICLKLTLLNMRAYVLVAVGGEVGFGRL